MSVIVTPKTIGRDQPLKVSVERNQLIIKIGVDTLAFADKSRREFEMGKSYNILDPLGFAQDVADELTREDEVGATPLTNLLDEMMDFAIDNGSAHVEH